MSRVLTLLAFLLFSPQVWGADNCGLGLPKSCVMDDSGQLTANLVLGQPTGVQSSSIGMYGATSGLLTVKPFSTTSNWTFTFPSGTGSNGQVLSTDGAGNSSWINAAGNPAGSSGQIQYNNAGAFAGASGLTTAGLSLTDTQSIGSTSTDGFIIQNTTAAAAGAQQWSPRLHLIGQGWKTNATAASQTVDWIIENQPIQGAANPSTNLVISSQINGAGYTAQLTLGQGSITFPTNILITTSSGDMNIQPPAGASLDLGSNASFQWQIDNSAGRFKPISDNQSDIGATPSNRVKNFWGVGSITGQSFLSTGSSPTNSGTCAINTQVGGNTAGTFKANGACAAGTIILTFATTAPNGWVCTAQDLTTPADVLTSKSSTTTTFTWNPVTMAASDVVQFQCMGF